jgi:hypothetical protein
MGGVKIDRKEFFGCIAASFSDLIPLPLSSPVFSNGIEVIGMPPMSVRIKWSYDWLGRKNDIGS